MPGGKDDYMDVMAIVTERIMADLEQGVIPWERPWCTVDGAYNRVTGRTYSLLNQMLLRHPGEYASYKQWVEAGGTIRKGAEGEVVVFWKFPVLDDKNLDSGEGDSSGGRADSDSGYSDLAPDKHLERVARTAPVLRYYRVFHISQVEGVEPIKTDSMEQSDNTPIDKAEALLHGYLDREGVRLECGPSNEAYYSPLRDVIHIPSLSQFRDSESFYATMLHESVHSTAAEKRLARKEMTNVVFGSETYSKEELIAEIGSSCLMHHLGISTRETERNTSAYVQGWLRALRNDRRMIVYAAGQAEKAVKYILSV